jgi:[ribosomal protein S5]-alanine N-acetyltransferase
VTVEVEPATVFPGALERCLAHTRPETNASNAVFQRCGFTFAGAIDDPNAGPVWRWELAL